MMFLGNCCFSLLLDPSVGASQRQRYSMYYPQFLCSRVEDLFFLCSSVVVE